MGEAFGWAPARTHAYNWVNGLRDGVLLVDEHDGEIRGTSAAITFGATGWVAASPSRRTTSASGSEPPPPRRRATGCASAGAETLLLFATEAGRPVYEALGFEVDCDYISFQVPEGGQGPPVPANHDVRAYELVRALDREATGEVRDVVLEAGFPRGARVGERGMAVQLPWGQTGAVALDEETGRQLLALAQPRSRWVVPERAGGPMAPELVWGAFNVSWG